MSRISIPNQAKAKLNVNYFLNNCKCPYFQIRDDDIIRLLAVQFSWNGVRGKPLCSVFIGSSPEFEIAAYTVTLLLDRNGKLEVNMGEYEVELTVHSYGSSHYRKLGTAYMAAARFDDYARKRGWHS